MEMSRCARRKVVSALRTALAIQQGKLSSTDAGAIVALLQCAIDDEEPDPYWWESNLRAAEARHQKRATFLKGRAAARRLAESAYREGWENGRATGTWRAAWMESSSRQGVSR
jgi:hypothetical protein